MTEKRAFAASIVVSNTSFWITGGYQGGGPAEAGLSSSEYIENGISRYLLFKVIVFIFFVSLKSRPFFASRP